MSKLAHSNQETMDEIERDARERDERGEPDEPWEQWKIEALSIPPPLLNELAKVVCRQINCTAGQANREPGSCALCADTAENVVGEFLALRKATGAG